MWTPIVVIILPEMTLSFLVFDIMMVLMLLSLRIISFIQWIKKALLCSNAKVILKRVFHVLGMKKNL